MPTLKTVVDNLDDIGEALRDSYIEKDGKFVLDLEGVDDHPAVISLRNALERQKQERKRAVDELKTQREENKTLKERLVAFPEAFDPEEYERMKAQIEEYESDPTKRGQTDKEKQEAVAARRMLEQKIANMEKAHVAEIAKRDALIKRKDTFIGQLLVDEGLTKALVEVGISKDFMKAAKALLRQDCKVVEEDEEYRAIVETDTGPLDISKYVSDWAASDEGKAFVPPAKGSDAGGGGGKPPKIASTEKNPWSKENWNMTEQGKMIRADRVKADKLARAAGHRIPDAA